MPTTVTFEQWTSSRRLASIGTNAGSAALPFQNWKPFKEAFAPELIERVVRASAIPVRSLIDPFGGSGTTALAAQFLGIEPIAIEVNPYLADLTRAKVESYDLSSLLSDYTQVVAKANGSVSIDEHKAQLPVTFIEPGKNERYIFDRAVGDHILRLAGAISQLESDRNGRLLKVLLGGVMLDVSNIRVSGKGRRYRTNWRKIARPTVRSLCERYAHHFQTAVADIASFGDRACLDYTVINGDSREIISGPVSWDAAVFSPPYPNSFDYTDVYNVELWMLGYLKDKDDNRSLRTRTLSSHVQIKREFAAAPEGSSSLNTALQQLTERSANLWDPNIPAMVGAYFADLLAVTENVKASLSRSGLVAMVVGNSQYGETLVDVAQIVAELAEKAGLEIIEKDPFRSMRRSPQQGGRAELHESLIILRRAN